MFSYFIKNKIEVNIHINLANGSFSV